MCTRVYKGVPYYYCSNRHNKYDSCPDIPAVRADLVDILAWQECCALFERIDAIHTQLSREIERAVAELLEDTTGREHITELEALIDYAKEERTKYAEGSYMHTLITQDLSTKEEQLRRFKAECASAGTVAATTAMYQARVLDFLEFLNVMHGQYDTATFLEKRNALDVLGIKVRLTALPEEQRKRGKIPTVAEIRARMSITYSPLFTGVQSSGEGLPQNQ